jgi:ribosomal protein S18 acetylase RimI-like enzyme
MTVHIGLAGKNDIPTCARLIAEALRDDPVVRQIVGGDEDRTTRLTELYTAELRTGALAHGVIDVARTAPGGPIIGVAAWEGPHHAVADWRQLLELPRYLRAIGPRHVPAAFRALRAFSGPRPTTRHWYLADIAASPNTRGRGVGSALFTYRLAAIDSQALPAYLEATTPASQRLYERHGFRAGSPIDLAPGISATAMTRPRTDRA